MRSTGIGAKIIRENEFPKTLDCCWSKRLLMVADTPRQSRTSGGSTICKVAMGTGSSFAGPERDE